MKKLSKKYYFISAVIGLTLGALIIFMEYKVWSSFLETNKIVFEFSQYNFHCSGKCALIAHTGYILFGAGCLYLGVDAIKKYRNS
jgi:hypothetical protein